jgi:mono/diheme cytochrome c family protein
MRFSQTLIVVAVVAVVLAACSKGSNSSASSTAAAGSKVFMANCASCHQADGKGVAGTFPPLAGSAIVTGDSVKVIHIVKYGLTGPVAVSGKTYNGMMPAWSSQLSNADIAAAISYIRSSWGDNASPVTADQVSAVSK